MNYLKSLSFVSKNDYSSVRFFEKPAQKHKTRVLLITKYPQLDTPNIYICVYVSKSFSIKKNDSTGEV